MRTLRRIIIAGGGLLLAAVALSLPLVFGRPQLVDREEPWSQTPHHPEHMDHAHLIRGPLPDGPSVTRACLKCHPQAAKHLMQTAHWNWLGDPVKVPGRAEPVRMGKRNLLNNYCIGIQSNWESCTICHAGYGWKDDSFDFTKEEDVDCLVCHDTSGMYRKEPQKAGLPAADVDLVAAARSVGIAKRTNCGTCHFSGGGGDAVKHGDLDGSMYFPPERLDVHMGRLNFLCTDCHRTRDHRIPGRSMSVTVETDRRVACTDCHSQKPHRQERLDAHTRTVACQTCHIPKMAVEAATKMTWDWSTAGKDLADDPHVYLKKKGSFTYAKNIPPEYYWYNGRAERYLLGDKIDPDEVSNINRPLGDVRDADARIWPFKVHRGKQLFDAEHRYFLVPATAGNGGYWHDFDWDKAARIGAKAAGLQYSGKYGFARSVMYWPLSHMVAPKEEALQCTDCHGDGGRMNWNALGYPGDPAFRGGRGLSVALKETP
jgi:octaheme c-type cytochrome (tetrathionate reductase family)